MNRRSTISHLIVLLAATLMGCASTVPDRQAAEARTAAHFDAIRDDPAALMLFLRAMPKGGDLHNHLSGSIYAENYIRWGAEDDLCISTVTWAFTSRPCDAAAGEMGVTEAQQRPVVYRNLIDALSLRNWHPARRSGHEQFFEAFGRFGRVSSQRTGEMLAEVASRSASQKLSYLELMLTADDGHAIALSSRVEWDPDLAAMTAKLRSEGIVEAVTKASSNLDAAESRMREVLRCGTPEADAGCDVTIRYLYQVGRNAPPNRVFSQILAGFELARGEPRIVGFNMVMPEDYPIALRDFRLHMQMIDFLAAQYPEVNIALHAGELMPGLVPPEHLRFHIRDSIRLGRAKRIGHGVSIVHEDAAEELLDELARGNVLVEVALSSNDQILGLTGRQHPLRTYLRYGVPATIVTDDEGVSRSTYTNELRRAVEEHRISYVELKTMLRNSLEYAFMEGASLWRDRRRFVPLEECSPASGGFESESCETLARGSRKATLQRELEVELAAFEQSVPSHRLTLTD